MIKEYYDGILEGLFRYAWMKDGVYYVGSCGSTLKSAQANVEAERIADKELLMPKDKIIADLEEAIGHIRGGTYAQAIGHINETLQLFREVV